MSTPAKRRLYDSIDEFDDTVPIVCQANKDNFFKVFGKVVVENARYVCNAGDLIYLLD